MVQNVKKIWSVALHISGTIYHIIVIYSTMCNIQVFLLNFQNVDFWVVRGVKDGPKCQKILSVCLTVCTLGTIHHMIVILVHMCKMMISLGIFPFFQNFDFWHFWDHERAKHNLKLPISVCHTLHL